MTRPDLLPGVTTEDCPPTVVADSRATILRARRHAALRDSLNMILLGAVDYVCVTWPSAHVPFVGREHSVTLVALLNAAVITHVIMSRLTARWAARRIASTWSLRERARFFQRETL
jgi:hypothetical protein